MSAYTALARSWRPRRFADMVGAKYGSDLRVHDQPGQSRVVVTLHPHKVNAVNMGG